MEVIFKFYIKSSHKLEYTFLVSRIGNTDLLITIIRKTSKK